MKSAHLAIAALIIAATCSVSPPLFGDPSHTPRPTWIPYKTDTIRGHPPHPTTRPKLTQPKEPQIFNKYDKSIERRAFATPSPSSYRSRLGKTPGADASLNPQPLPPGPPDTNKTRFNSKLANASLNPQPLPPGPDPTRAYALTSGERAVVENGSLMIVRHNGARSRAAAGVYRTKSGQRISVGADGRATTL
jgi:hypothetical protein